MSKYEIMLIIDPNSDEKNVSEIASSTFKSGKDLKIEKLERTELAYEINKSKTAIYFVINVTATGDEINEFTRKANITKNIWRSMSVNLDSEKGLNRKAKPKRVKKPFVKKPNKEGSRENFADKRKPATGSSFKKETSTSNQTVNENESK